MCLLWFVVLGPILLTTILIHEIGHSLAARCVGGKAEGILLWPLGGLAYIALNASPKGEARAWMRWWLGWGRGGRIGRDPQLVGYRRS